MSISILLISPLLIFLQRKPLGLFVNIFSVMVGMKSWIGLSPIEGEGEDLVSGLMPGILTPVPFLKEKSLNQETRKRMNLLYAKDYRIRNDLSIIIRDIKFLGGQ